MIKEFSGNFSSTLQFDKESSSKLAEFFNIDYVNRDPAEYKLFFQNLKKLAYQNLGLAHCVIHNQTAHNAVQQAYKITGFECYKKSLDSHIGAFSFGKTTDTNNLIFDDTNIKGSRTWISQLETSDFLLLFIRDIQSQNRFVFVDLEKQPQQIINTGNNLIGMKVAMGSNIVFDVNLPEEWITDRYLSTELIHRVTNFHYYGLITNYVGNARALLDLGTALANKNHFQVDFNIKSLYLQVRVLESLWIKNMDSTLESYSDEYARIREAQYLFGKKTLIDIIQFFLQITNSSMFDVDSLETQPFRDALVFSSHISNLYKNLTWGCIEY